MVLILILLLYMGVVSVGGVAVIVQFRMRAGELKIRARSPALATFPGVYAVVVGGILIPLQEVVQLQNLRYPCRLNLWQSWLFLPVWGAPFALRSVRVVVASSKAWRETYGVLLRRNTTLKMLAFICMVAVGILVTLEEILARYKPGNQGTCYMFMEWEVLLPFCVLQSVIFGVLGKCLADVDDLLNISNELRVNFMSYLVFALPYFVLQFYFRTTRKEEDFPTWIQFFISAMVVLTMLNTMWVSVGGLKRLKDCIGLSCDGGSTAGGTSIAYTDKASTIVGQAMIAEESFEDEATIPVENLRKWKLHYNCTATIMEDELMVCVYQKLAERALCSESFDFLADAREYRGNSSVEAGIGLQHLLFTDICRIYIASNSEREINISHNLKAHLVKYRDYAAFNRLTVVERNSLLLEAEKEISEMLQLNLLGALHQSDEFAEACTVLEKMIELDDLEMDRNRSGCEEEGHLLDSERLYSSSSETSGSAGILGDRFVSHAPKG